MQRLFKIHKEVTAKDYKPTSVLTRGYNCDEIIQRKLPEVVVPVKKKREEKLKLKKLRLVPKKASTPRLSKRQSSTEQQTQCDIYPA